MAVSCSVATFVVAPRNSVGRVRRAMTTSSTDAFPARSPSPLTVTSTCRAPAWMPASVFAVARPRSLWQWVDTIARRPHSFTTCFTTAANSFGSA